jgi:hypothetical protein
MSSKIAKGVMIAFAVLLNMSAFYYVALSGIGLLDKAVLFTLTVLLDISLMRYRDSMRIDELLDRISKANLELIAADTEIMYSEMFSSTDSLVNLVHDHIKRAIEHLNDVRR